MMWIVKPGAQVTVLMKVPGRESVIAFVPAANAAASLPPPLIGFTCSLIENDASFIDCAALLMV
jgi:hypothetical protein